MPEHLTPYLKWAGGKARIAARILEELPAGQRYARLVEPFLGSGAFALNAARLVDGMLLADANPDLVALHRRVVSDPDMLIEEARLLFRPENNTDARYREVRAAFNASADPAKRAVLFLYLNKHCFNGLCRYNRSGEFNVPFGKMKAPRVPEEAIRGFAEALAGADVQVADFRSLMAEAGKGDLLYCDPPYAPLTETANFAAYAAGGFGEQDQRDLARLAEEARQRGATVLVSNHDTPFTRGIYQDANKITEMSVKRSVSASGGARGDAKEIVATYFPGDPATDC